jgi:hypothetical protein
MVPPEEWRKRWLGTFRLNADGRWLAEKTSEDFDLRTWIGG